MTGIDTLTAAPASIAIGNRTLRIAPLTLDDLGIVQRWINAQVPDHIALARRLVEGLPADAAGPILAEAYRDAKAAARNHQMGMPAAQELLGTPAGLLEVCYHAIRRHQPELTRDVVGHLIGSLSPDQLGRVMSVALGVEDEVTEGDPSKS